MNDCVFCKIINKEIPSNIIYEDEKVMVFMTHDPNTNGHLLLIPRAHQITFDDIDNEFITYSLSIIRDKIYPLLKERLGAEGLTISQNNYLGQEVKHFHIHLIPRYYDDGASYTFDTKNLKSLDEVYNILTKKD